MTQVRGNDLLIARSTAKEELRLTALQRSMHLYTVRATGSGKSQFLEYLIRQDIKNWIHSECGLLLLDPHGSARATWVVAYVSASVVTDNMVDALAHVWGAGDTDKTPLMARTAATVFQALYEHKRTLVEALTILDFSSHDFRARLATTIEDETTRVNLERMNNLRPQDYNAES